MRLIDADALDEEVMHLFITITGAPKQSTVVNECKRSFRKMIDEQPTIDVTDTNAGKHTNADRIRSMTDEELADLLRETVKETGENLFSCEDFKGKPDCILHSCDECGAYLKWLQSEVEEWSYVKI